jgi:hypothetical protein
MFVYMIMGLRAHEAITTSEYVINFIGRDHGVVNGGGSGLTGARGFVSPDPLLPVIPPDVVVGRFLQFLSKKMPSPASS